MMNKTFEICNLVLATADLMDLIEITNNENEYTIEASLVAKYINDYNPNIDELARYIRRVFATYFEVVFDMECMELIADCIIKNLECEEE